MTSRRHIIALLPLAGGVSLLRAQAPGPVLDPKDAQAVSLGYVVDAAQVNKTKYPKYAGGQACSNCQLYQGAAGSAQGPCPIYQNRQVAAKGWCSAWVKKA
ncbi:high-potential iron-sulfur protein [Ideonella sp. DXS29W]|uniref:High-potential iron-sulfur protein n=1 Tax=Ideonella lacteola TaxID=2984193 RepID=A0ABU9BMV8_9BURK